MSQQDIVDTLIEKQGTLFSESMGIDLSADSAEADFAWLVGSILLAKRISHSLAERAGKALNEAGLMSVEGICEADEKTLIHTLGENGYKRYRELATDYLKATARWVRDELGGDLRSLRSGDADAVLERLHGAKGIGDVGAEIFAREAQWNWDEFYPRLEGPAADKARELGLASEHGPLVSMAGSRERFIRLAAALSRAAVDETDEEVEDAADD
ncbi:MAG: hypothetical protein V2I39_08500 [Erythrobacter sp.]|jgi:hypothetical protein|nr:hypothetical protein [Erythrobacter sp.]